MSVYKYDESIINNLRKIINDDRIYIVPTDNVFSLIARLSSDEIKLPLISLTRIGWSLSDNKSHVLKFDGAKAEFEYSDADKEEIESIKSLQSIPISINYQMDIWTKDRIDNDNLLRELIFYYSTHPTLLVDIEYDLNIKHRFNIFFDGDIIDNSDIVEHKNRGEYYRQTIGLYTDDAYLWKVSSRKPNIINPELLINDILIE